MPGREADHSHPSSTDVKEWVELCLHSPNTPSWRGAQLGEHRDDLAFLGRGDVCFRDHIESATFHLK
jgi:hypothetical protein